MDVSDVHMKTWFVILMLILCVAMPQTLHGQNSQLGIASHSLKVINPVFASFNESSPITINGDADFISQANSSGWDGNGTEVSPFIISGLNITSALIGNPLAFSTGGCILFISGYILSHSRHKTLQPRPIGTLPAAAGRWGDFDMVEG